MKSDWIVDATIICDKGLIRNNNEDSFYFDGYYASVDAMNLSVRRRKKRKAAGSLWTVCDGMGGQSNGEIASHTAVSSMQELQNSLHNHDFDTTIQEWVKQLSCTIEKETEGGTTLALLFCSEQNLQTAHVGDSRIYRLHEGRLIRLTRDHTKVEMMLSAGMITEEEAKVHPQRHALSRYLGMDSEYICNASIGEKLPYCVGDRYFLCSDGVTDMLSDDQLEMLLQRTTDCETCASNIRDAVFAAGAVDNTTLIVLDILSDKKTPGKKITSTGISLNKQDTSEQDTKETISEEQSSLCKIPMQNARNNPENGSEAEQILPRKRKWQIPLVAVLTIGIVVCILWGTGALTPRYTITWQDETGRTIDVVSAVHGTLPEHEAPVKEEDQQYIFTFAGWTPNIEKATGDVTYKAVYSAEKKVYTITWLDEKDRIIDAESIAYGATPAHKDPVKETDQQYTYVFAGWTPEIEPVTDDAAYKATFAAKVRTYRIIWQDDAGKTIDTADAVYGTIPEHTDPAKEADQQYTYTFIGWTPQVGTVTGDAAYRATFMEVPRVYTITWQGEEGKTIDTVAAAYGTIPEHTDPAKEANQQYTYTFTGWTPQVGTVTGDATYRATFMEVPRVYTITWQDEEGKTIDTVAAAYGTIPEHTDAVKDADQQYTYTFTGWTPEIEPVTHDIAYKALFSAEQRNYSITWQDDKGRTIDTVSAAYGTMPNHSNPVKEKDEQYVYIFDGWIPQIGTVTGDATYKATFKQVPVTELLPKSPEMRGYAKTKDLLVSVHSKPFRASRIIGLLPANTEVYVNGQDYKGNVLWYKIQFGIIQGYVRADKLSMIHR